MTKPLLILDFDGTLVDCKELHQEGFRQAVLSQYPDALYTNYEVEGLPTTAKISYLQAKGFPIDNHINYLKQLHTVANMNKYIVYNSELHDILNALCVEYTVSLATNGRKEFIDRALEILDLTMFHSIYTPNDGPSKPDTFMFDQCMKEANVTHSDTIIVEDSPMGIQCAISTGATVVTVTCQADTIIFLQSLL
jgi:HAD superfamily hydrolase (TIGR01509 family)